MKTHDSGSKKIYCLECREPITSREYLYVVLKDGANRAIHRRCHQKLDEMGLINSPIETTVSPKMMRSQFLQAVLVSLIFGVIFGAMTLSGMNGTFDWLFSIIFGVVVLLTITMPFIAMRYLKKGVSDQLWMPFERHLPATCRECHEEIPSNYKNCPACGWKYTQPEARLTNKVSK